jgi:methylamine---glutamate N-methyltransferase subunit A
MCGIVGLLHKHGNQSATVGFTVLAMLKALACRGPDSAGVALYGTSSDDRFVLRVKMGEVEHADLQARVRKVTELAESAGAIGDVARVGTYLCFHLNHGRNLTTLVASIEAISDEVEVVSAGRQLEIIKQVGSPANLEEAYGISQFVGSHGLGHTRLSTESRVDLSHSQPFWGRACPDLAIVHNGHITNYHRLRRRYEQRGVHFYTENDSEAIAVYLGEKLASGLNLQAALEQMLQDLDGSFSCLAATGTELGFVKDRFALKPLVVAETENFVAVATEEIAIRAALSGSYTIREGQAGEVRVWQR